MAADTSEPSNQRDWEGLRARGCVPGWQVRGPGGKQLPVAGLPPILRTLLVTDGTITQCLEAYFWERIVVRRLYQHTEVALEPIAWLRMSSGEQVVRRRVDLCGATSGRCYARCLSVVRPRLLPPALREDLLAGDLGIGELIRERGLETYRELLDAGLDAEGAQFPDESPPAQEIYRTYRIQIGGEPAILVTESFSLESIR